MEMRRIGTIALSLQGKLGIFDYECSHIVRSDWSEMTKNMKPYCI